MEGAAMQRKNQQFTAEHIGCSMCRPITSTDSLSMKHEYEKKTLKPLHHPSFTGLSHNN